MTKIAFLGLGAMGARMAARLLAAGHDVTVWNRTASGADGWAAKGARVASSPAAAAADGEIVVTMLRDDDAAAEVWLGPAGALAGLRTGAVGIECSTLSLPGVRRIAAAFAAAGHAFVDAPLAGSRPQAEAGSLIFLVGGEPGIVERVRPVLSAMGVAVHHAGPTGAGCLAKLYVNAMFGAQLALTGEFVALSRRAGFDPTTIVSATAETPVASPALRFAAPAMLGDSFPPAFPIDLVAKDFAMVARTGEAVGAPVPVATEVGRVFAEARAAGLGDLNATGIVKWYAA